MKGCGREGAYGVFQCMGGRYFASPAVSREITKNIQTVNTISFRSALPMFFGVSFSLSRYPDFKSGVSMNYRLDV